RLALHALPLRPIQAVAVRAALGAPPLRPDHASAMYIRRGYSLRDLSRRERVGPGPIALPPPRRPGEARMGTALHGPPPPHRKRTVCIQRGLRSYGVSQR